MVVCLETKSATVDYQVIQTVWQNLFENTKAVSEESQEDALKFADCGRTQLCCDWIVEPPHHPISFYFLWKRKLVFVIEW